MKFLSKIILLFSFLVSTLIANTNIDECKSDLYYANGIMIEETENKAREIWGEEVADMFLPNPEEFEKLDIINVSYNASQGRIDDIFESFEQIMSNEWGWEDFSGYFRTYLELKGYQDSDDLHRPDLTAQVSAYKQSIKDGHGVIVIAHSQGNYYTNEAYEELDDWMKEYFHMFGVATPANHVAGYDVDDIIAPYVKFHNDFINIVLTSLSSNRDDTRHHGFPSIDAHDFYESYLKEETTKNDIFNFILNQIQIHSDAPTQWETDQELNKATKEYCIILKHRFDSSIVMSEEVYPFAPSKKLYQVNNKYVKASCGGSEVFNEWTNQKENEVYLINNPQEEKIILECLSTQYFDSETKACKDYSGYRFTYNGTEEFIAKGESQVITTWEPTCKIGGIYYTNCRVVDSRSYIEDSVKATDEDCMSRVYPKGFILDTLENLVYKDTDFSCPQGQYVEYTKSIIITEKNTFKLIERCTVGGAPVEKLREGCAPPFFDLIVDPICPSPVFTAWKNHYYGKTIYATDYQTIRYGTFSGIK